MPQRSSIFTLNSTTIYNLYFMYRKIVFCITLLLFDFWDDLFRAYANAIALLHCHFMQWQCKLPQLALLAAVYILNPSHSHCIDPTLTYRIIKPCLPNRSIRHFRSTSLFPLFACPFVYQRGIIAIPGFGFKPLILNIYIFFFHSLLFFLHPFSQLLLLFIIQNSICKVV